MKTICVRAKIRNGSIANVRKWFQTLKDRSNEVYETLKSESVVIESVFLDKFGDDHYLIYYMKAENLEQAQEAYKNSTFAIDQYHKECWKKYCEGRQELELLADFERI